MLGQAVKIALEVKKYLVDNDLMDISQVCLGQLTCHTVEPFM